MSKTTIKEKNDPTTPWMGITERATPEIKKIIEKSEQIITELKSISANMNRIATLIQTRFGELEQR